MKAKSKDHVTSFGDVKRPIPIVALGSAFQPSAANRPRLGFLGLAFAKIALSGASRGERVAIYIDRGSQKSDERVALVVKGSSCTPRYIRCRLPG
jgi:hypothetical protein